MPPPIKMKLTNGAEFYVETEPVEPAADSKFTPGGAALGDAPAALTEKAFSDAVSVVDGVAAELTDKLVKADNRHKMSEVELELKLGFDAKGNLWFFKGGVNASLSLKLKWSLPDAR